MFVWLKEDMIPWTQPEKKSFIAACLCGDMHEGWTWAWKQKVYKSASNHHVRSFFILSLWTKQKEAHVFPVC